MAKMEYDPATDTYRGTHNGMVVEVSDLAMLGAMCDEAQRVTDRAAAQGQEWSQAGAAWLGQPSQAETTDYWLERHGG